MRSDRSMFAGAPCKHDASLDIDLYEITLPRPKITAGRGVSSPWKKGWMVRVVRVEFEFNDHRFEINPHV